MANLSFSLRERQNSARFNYVAVTISKMTSRSFEERNCFLTTTSNIALTFPTNTELVGCLEGGRELKFVTDLCNVCNGLMVSFPQFLTRLIARVNVTLELMF